MFDCHIGNSDNERSLQVENLPIFSTLQVDSSDAAWRRLAVLRIATKCLNWSVVMSGSLTRDERYGTTAY